MKKTNNNSVKSMLKVDFYRAFTSPLSYIMLAVALVVPVLILVMTTLMDGSVSVNPTTGEQTAMQGFEYTLQAIGSLSTANAMAMDLTGMCNINLVYFFATVVVCVFVCQDFSSGYAKNIFSGRANNSHYVLSKTLVCYVVSAAMLIAFFIGACLGGAISGLPFSASGVTVGNVIACMLSKLLLAAVFVPIYLLASVFAKQKTWLAIVLSLAVGMLLFMMIPSLTPLDCTLINVALCLAGGALFSVGLGAVSTIVLKKRDIL